MELTKKQIRRARRYCDVAKANLTEVDLNISLIFSDFENLNDALEDAITAIRAAQAQIGFGSLEAEGEEEDGGYGYGY